MAEDETSARTGRVHEDLIEVEELVGRLGAEDLVILDVRYDLADPEAGLEAYRRGHIPGAVFLDLERDLAGPKGTHGGRHPLPPVDRLARTFGLAGIDARSEVVVYDEDAMYAPHAWWLLRYLGHDKVRILNGGLPRWRKAGYPLSTRPAEPAPRTFVAHPHHDWVVDRHRARRLGPGQVLIDARAPERYRGEFEPIDPRAGHIPGAVNVYWAEGLDPDGRWLPPERQRERFLFAEDAREVICYCGSGVSACADLFALHLAGRTGRVYRGSFSDWASYPELPVVTGQHPLGLPVEET